MRKHWTYDSYTKKKEEVNKKRAVKKEEKAVIQTKSRLGMLMLKRG